MSKSRATIRFLVSFDGIVDLLTIIPAFFLSGFVIFRMLRVARVFHLFRLNAKYDPFNVITTVLYEKRNQIISSVFIVLILMLASSLCMYSVEHDAQPEVFRNAFSGIWWSMSTLLTVGYGWYLPDHQHLLPGASAKDTIWNWMILLLYVGKMVKYTRQQWLLLCHKKA